MARGVTQKKEQLPSVINFAEDASDGMEGLSSQDYAIPYLSILQKMSPQLDTLDVKPGQIFNTVTEIAVDQLTVVPCAYVRNFVEWIPRDQGGGLVAVHAINSLPEHSRVDGKLVTKEGHLLVETANHFVLTLDGSVGVDRGLIVMTSTQLKKNRRWNSLMAGIKLKDPKGKIFTPARYSHMYRLTTVQEKNEQGSWYGWNVDLVSPITEQQLYSLAKDFSNQVQSGAVKTGPPQQELSAEPSETF